MRKLVISLLFLIGMVIPASAQNNTTRFFIAYDYENLTVDNTAGGVAFDIDKINASDGPANLITFTVTCSAGTDCPFRLTMDGTAPTSTVGIRLNSGQSANVYSRTNITAFRAIREGATDAVLNTQFYR